MSTYKLSPAVAECKRVFPFLNKRQRILFINYIISKYATNQSQRNGSAIVRRNVR